MMKFYLIYPGLMLLAYLLGAIPWGLVLTRLFTSHDLRQKGSGNIGATNVRRVAGVRLGALTLAADVLKGALPVYVATIVPDNGGLWGDTLAMQVALCAFFGHLYPVFLRFKNGGKGVATAAGCLMVLSPAALAGCLLTFIMVVGLTRYVSAGSIAAALVLPVAIFMTTRSWPMTGFAAVICVMVILRHRENIKRLWAGTESPAWTRRK